ncbi:MAG: hypothetical protein FWH12_08530 [Treponema sp.]|nr:hypothetical protein [Treponema sp.]
MADDNGYVKALSDALNARADWLERSELPKMKDELRAYHTGFASLYNLFLKKGLIHEDPYKHEARIAELEVPSTAPYSDAEKLDQLTRRLANYDNQLDFLVNFYQFSTEFLNLERIKRILGLVKYVDWIHLSPDSQNPMTKAVAEMTNQVKSGSDQLTMSVISESLSNLNRTYNPIMGYLKLLSDYQREYYKLGIRDVTQGMSHGEAANLPALRKKLVQAKPGIPFFPDLVEEVLKEDYSKDSAVLRDDVLKRLQVVEAKPKVEKVQVSFKSILIEGIQNLGNTAGTFTEILQKLDENQAILEDQRDNIWRKLKKMLNQMFNKEPEPIIYDLEYIDPVKASSVRERVNFTNFRNDLDRKIRTLSPLGPRGAALPKLESMQEDQLVGFLERNIRDLQSLHKTLGALDELFKSSVDKDDRDKIRGIKPDLGSLKNAILRANAKRHEYNAHKEEEEQLRRLGVNPDP